MIRLFSFVLPLVLILSATNAKADQLEKQANELIDIALQSKLSWQLLESLTTEVGPRLAGTEAEKRARDWAVIKLTDLGFNNIHVEDFTMTGWERGMISVQVGAPYSQPLTAIALGKSIGTPVGGINAPVVRFADFPALLAAEESSLIGKIAFLDGTMTRTQDGSGYGLAGPRRWTGAAEASRRGAIAVLVRSVGTDTGRNPHTGGTSYSDDAPHIPAAALSSTDADQLARLLALKPELQVHFTQTSRILGDVPSGNVIAEITGSKYPDEIILIGAHLDSWDNSPGAQDDGSGVAIVTAAAKIITDYGQPERTIRLVLFGAEEQGLLGARAYLAAHKDNLSQIMMVSESDFGAGRVWRMDTGIAKADEPKADRIQAVLARLGVTKGLRTANGGPDVSVLSAAGVPAISLKQDGWNYFDIHHTPNDTLDKVDPADLAQNTAVYAAYIWMIANIEGGFQPPSKQN
ncbi:MAG: M20/M25/M40 family metallo-hydrolase [Robiginitomaculum sp.]|nr:M20/M25/M40 family metallo-hydrolase [Robiginitomaculum sp.]